MPNITVRVTGWKTITKAIEKAQPEIEEIMQKSILKSMESTFQHGPGWTTATTADPRTSLSADDLRAAIEKLSVLPKVDWIKCIYYCKGDEEKFFDLLKSNGVNFYTPKDYDAGIIRSVFVRASPNIPAGKLLAEYESGEIRFGHLE